MERRPRAEQDRSGPVVRPHLGQSFLDEGSRVFPLLLGQAVRGVDDKEDGQVFGFPNDSHPRQRCDEEKDDEKANRNRRNPSRAREVVESARHPEDVDQQRRQRQKNNRIGKLDLQRSPSLWVLRYPNTADLGLS